MKHLVHLAGGIRCTEHPDNEVVEGAAILGCGSVKRFMVPQVVDALRSKTVLAIAAGAKTYKMKYGNLRQLKIQSLGKDFEEGTRFQCYGEEGVNREIGDGGVNSGGGGSHTILQSASSN